MMADEELGASDLETREGMAARIHELEARIKELEAQVGANSDPRNLNDVKLVSVVFNLPLTMARLLNLLRSTAIVTPDMAEERLGMGTDLNVAIHRLRLQLRKSAPEIEIKNQYNVGYWLAVETKERINRMVRSFREGGEL
jgi:hypothetical protein